MAQFQVPQFIDTEDKIIGPFSIKQFIFLAIAGAISGLLFFILSFWLWAVIASLIMAIAFSFALIKINGRGLAALTLSAFNYYWSPQYYAFKPHGKSSGPAVKVKPGGLKNIGEQLATTKTSIPSREKTFVIASETDQKKIDERYELIRKTSGDKEMARRVDYR